MNFKLTKVFLFRMVLIHVILKAGRRGTQSGCFTSALTPGKSLQTGSNLPQQLVGKIRQTVLVLVVLVLKGQLFHLALGEELHVAP